MRVPRKQIQDTKNLIKKFSSIKLIHYREVYDSIDYTNFHIATKVDFKRISRKNKSILKLWKQLKAENNVIYSYESPSGSEYIVNDQDEVFRLSDHWGAIAGCEWTIEGDGNLIPSIFVTGPVELGKAHISDFKIFRRKTSPKKDYVVNPVWKDKLRGIKKVVNSLQKLKDNPEFKALPNEDKQLIGSNFGNFRAEMRFVKDTRKTTKTY